eukprot:COSAG06_NODE_833_length_12029_cov_38.339868_9_plen_71_part_00
MQERTRLRGRRQKTAAGPRCAAHTTATARTADTMSSDDGPIVKEVTGKPLGSVNGGLAATEKLVATGALP